MSLLNSLTLASHEFRPKQKCSWCEPSADSSSLAYAQQEAHTNLQELETSPGNPTLQRIFAGNLAHVFLSLITALSYMGKTRVTQTVNIHGWKNAIAAGCFQFESEIKRERTNVTVPTLSAQCGVQQGNSFFSFFLLFATMQKLWLWQYIPSRWHILPEHTYLWPLQKKPQKRWGELWLSFIKKTDHMPTTIHATSSRGNEEKSAVNSSYVQRILLW